MLEAGHIARPGGGVAAHVGHARGGRLGDALRHAVGEAGARGVHHERVQPAQLGQLAGGVAAHHLDVHAVHLGVAAQVAHRRPGGLDGDDVGPGLRERHGERAAAGVQVGHEQPVQALGALLAHPAAQAIHDLGCQLLGLGGVHLEERRRAGQEARTGQLLAPAALAVEGLHSLYLARAPGVGQHAHDARGLERALERLRHMGAGERAGLGPQRDLGLARAQAVPHAHPEDPQVGRALSEPQRAAQGLGRLGDGIMGERADGRRGDVVRALAMEAQQELAVLRARGAQLQLVAVAPLPLARQAGAHEVLGARGVEARRVHERAYDVGALRLQLGLVGQVLPRAAAAGVPLRAARLHTLEGGLLDRHDARPRERGLLLHHLHAHGVAGRAARHEHRLAARQAPHGLGPVPHALDAQRLFHEFGFP